MSTSKFSTEPCAKHKLSSRRTSTTNVRCHLMRKTRGTLRRDCLMMTTIMRYRLQPSARDKMVVLTHLRLSKTERSTGSLRWEIPFPRLCQPTRTASRLHTLHQRRTPSTSTPRRMTLAIACKILTEDILTRSISWKSILNQCLRSQTCVWTDDYSGIKARKWSTLRPYNISSNIASFISGFAKSYFEPSQLSPFNPNKA